jgi:anti-anti-sigma factor
MPKIKASKKLKTAVATKGRAKRRPAASANAAAVPGLNAAELSIEGLMESAGEPPPENEAAAAIVDARADTVARLSLEAGAEIKDVEVLRERLIAAFDRGLPISLDVGHLSAIDTAGVQVLLAAQKEAQKRGVRLEFVGESPVLTHALNILGLQDSITMAIAP